MMKFTLMCMGLLGMMASCIIMYTEPPLTALTILTTIPSSLMFGMNIKFWEKDV